MNEALLGTNFEIKRLLQKKELSAVLQLMKACQDRAFEISKLIEDLEGEGTKTAAMLVQYHETLYYFGNNLEIIDTSFVELLQDQLLKIENNIKSELKPDRIEVAFFPYKASMWDSLESIWLAANEDPDCDAYVVPIPYFDRKPNREFGQMHYEGNQYPDNIHVVDWRTYDLEQHRPDIIFIHNPYDDNNHVTSVHPDYYSGRLKRFTELLCYVPYFVSYGKVADHFILCPGVLNADRVFLQSEDVRDTYIQVVQDFEKKHRCPGRFGDIETKFISLGSPKIDRVLNAKREDCKLPEEWEKLIEGKKVFFYNTSIGEFLHGREQYLKKIRSVLDTFRSRNDVVLWWRPHPLIETTCRSMIPHLLTEYKKIVADFKQGGWGIYDDSPDLHRALTMSDALIGDCTSITSMYNVTGKPEMSLDTELTDRIDDEEREEFLHSDIINFVATPDGDAEWGFSATCNALYKISIDNATANYISSVPYEKNIEGLYSAPIEVGDKLFLVPSSAHSFAFYNVSTGEWTKRSVSEYCLPDADRDGQACSVFAYSVYCGDHILILPGDRGVFAKYDIESGEITYYSEWFKQFKPYIKNIFQGIFAGSCRIYGKLFLSSLQCNIVTELEPNHMTFKYHKVGAVDNQYCGITYMRDSFWLIKHREYGKEPWEDGLVKWDSKSGECVEYNNLPIVQEEQYKGRGIASFIRFGTSLYLFPSQSKDIIKFDTISNQSEIVTLNPEYNYFDRKSKLYTWAKDSAFPWVTLNKVFPYPWEKTVFNTSTILAQMPYDYSLMKLDILSGEYTLKKWKVKGAAEKLARKEVSFDKELRETALYALDNFLDDIVSGDSPAIDSKRLHYHRKLETNADGTSGSKIYKCIRERVVENCNLKLFSVDEQRPADGCLR